MSGRPAAARRRPASPLDGAPAGRRCSVAIPSRRRPRASPGSTRWTGSRRGSPSRGRPPPDSRRAAAHRGGADGALPREASGAGWATRSGVASPRSGWRGRPEDPFGLDVATVERALPAVLALYRFWFRVQSEGHEHLPRRGGAILVANHGGLLPFDGAMAAVDVLLQTTRRALLRPLVARFVRDLPLCATSTPAPAR